MLKRPSLTLLVGAMGLLVLLGAAALGWHLRERETEIYTDADRIRQGAEGAMVRSVLWEPPVGLPPVINSPRDEHEPHADADGTLLLFVRGEPGRNCDLMQSVRTPRGWSEPTPLDGVNSDADELGPALSPDGQRLYFHSDRAGGQGGYDLWVAERRSDGPDQGQGQEWGPARNLGPDVNSRYHDYGAALAPDGTTLYYASNRPGPEEADVPAPDAPLSVVREDLARRDYDLFRAILTPEGPQPPAPVAALNTSANDVAPAVSPIGDFVYFCSDRPGGAGGFDVYRARSGPYGLAAPESLDEPVNTAANELDPTVSLGGFGLYFSSDRYAETGGYDVYFSRSREVFREVETYRATIDWSSVLAALLKPATWVLLAMLALLFVMLLFMLMEKQKFGRLSLLARCLFVSLLLHTLLMLAFTFWTVSASLAEVFQRGSGTQVRLASNAAAGDLARQLRGGLADVEVEPEPMSGARQEVAVPAEAPSAMAALSVDRAPADIASTFEAPAAAVDSVPQPAPAPEPDAAATPTPATVDVDVPRPAARQSETESRTSVEGAVADADSASRAAPSREATATTEVPVTEVVPAALPAQEAVPLTEPVRIADPRPTPSEPTSLPKTTMPPAEPDTVPVQMPGAARAESERVRESDAPLPTATAAAPQREATVAPPSGAQSPVPVRVAPPTAPMPTAPTSLAARPAAVTATPSVTTERLRPPSVAATASATALDVAVPDRPEPVTPGASEQAAPLAVATAPVDRPDTATPTAAPAPAAITAAPPATGRPLDRHRFAMPGAADAATPAASSPPAAVSPVAAAVERLSTELSKMETTAAPALAEGRDVPDVSEFGAASGARRADAAPVNGSGASSPRLVAVGPARASTPTASSSLGTTPAVDARPRDASPSTPVPVPVAASRPIQVALPGANDATTTAAAPVTGTGRVETGEAAPRSTRIAAAPAAETLRPHVDLPAATTGAAAPLPSLVEVSVAAAPARGGTSTARPTGPRASVTAPDPLEIVLTPLEESAVAMTSDPQRALRRRLPRTHSAPAAVAVTTMDRERRDTVPPRDMAPIDIVLSHDRIVEIPQPRREDLPPRSESELIELDVDRLVGPVTPDLELTLPQQTLPPNPYLQRAPAVREHQLEQMGGTVATEAAVQLSLAWLARHQSADGHWDSRGFDDACGQCGDAAKVESDIGLTGLALLCFLAADHVPGKDSEYRDVVERGLAWLVKLQRSDGSLIGGESMYSHGIASIALAEALSMSGNDRLREPVRLATDFIFEARNRHVGGWRYAPGQVGDTSVVGWQIMALTSARRARIGVPEEAFDVGRKWMDFVQRRMRPGLYAYQPGKRYSPAMTAEGMFVRSLLGADRDEERQRNSAAFLLENLPDWKTDSNTYYWYYGTMALFQFGGEAWETWNERMKQEVLSRQHTTGARAGSWDTDDRWSKIGGRIYQTAMCTLTLEVYYRYLPSYLVQGE